MDTETVIVFIHQGNQEYFCEVLKYTRENNLFQTIIILGDESNRETSHQYQCQHYLAMDFTELWDYKHFSVNAYEYEKFCFERWIILKNWLLAHPDIQRVVHCDSDNVLLQDISFLELFWKQYDVLTFDKEDVLVPNLMVAHRDIMIHLGQEIISFYEQSKECIQSQITETINNTPHLSDMYLLIKWVKQYKVFNLSQASDSFSFLYFNDSFITINNLLHVFNHQFYIKERLLFNIHFAGNQKEKIKNIMQLLE